MDDAPYPIRGLVRFAVALMLATIVGSLAIAVIAASRADQRPGQLLDPVGAIAASPVAATDQTDASLRVITIVLDEMSFHPANITIPADQTVTLQLQNRGSLLHDFSNAELRISPDVRPGDTSEFKMNAPVGVYEIFCSIPGHRAVGMVASLHVEPAIEREPARKASTPMASPVLTRSGVDSNPKR